MNNTKKFISFSKTQIIIIFYFLVSITTSLIRDKNADISSSLFLSITMLLIFDIIYFINKRFKPLEYWQFFLYVMLAIIIHFLLFAIFVVITYKW